MNIKLRIIAMFAVLLTFSGCSTKSKAHYSRVFLCNYKNIDICEDMYWVSAADLNAAMTMYALSTDEGLEDYTDLTDEIVRHYFGCSTTLELREQALLDMVSARIIYGVFEELLQNSHMDFQRNDPSFENYYSSRMSCISFLADHEDSTVSAYLEKHYQMTESEFIESEIDFYVTVGILKALLEAENCSVQQAEIDCYRSTLAQQAGCSIEETHTVLDEDLFYSIAEGKLYELISEWYSAEISDAYKTVKHALKTAP